MSPQAEAQAQLLCREITTLYNNREGRGQSVFRSSLPSHRPAASPTVSYSDETNSRTDVISLLYSVYVCGRPCDLHP